jgi:hypothetical protein
VKKETKKKQKKEKKKLSSIKNNGGRFQVIAGHICRYMSICTDARTPRTHATLTPLFFNIYFNLEWIFKRWRGSGALTSSNTRSYKCFSPPNELGRLSQQIKHNRDRITTFLITPVSYVAFFRAHPANISYLYIFLSITSYYT